MVVALHAEFPGSAAADAVGSNTTEVRGRRAGVCLSDQIRPAFEHGPAIVLYTERLGMSEV